MANGDDLGFKAISADDDLGFVAAESKPKKYLPGRKFGMEVARGMGFDPEKIAAAEDTGGMWGGAKELGGQVVSGLGEFAGRVAHDPFHILDPVHSLASNLETGIRQRSPGQVLGASANILGGAEGAERAPGALGKVIPSKESIGSAMRTERGALKPGVRTVSQAGGALLGHATGIPGGEVIGFVLGRNLADAVIPKRPTPELPIRTSPFQGMTPTAGPRYTPFEGPQPQLLGTSAIQRAEPTFVEKFTPPGKPKIVSPESRPPHIEGSYWSFPEASLRKAVFGGDRDAAIVYKQRFGELPSGAGYLTDVGEAPTQGLYKSRR